MMLADFVVVIPVHAVGKGRPRFVRGRVITPPATVQYEALVRMLAQRAKPRAWDATGRYWVVVTIHERHGKGGRRGAAPDCDNVGKAVLDALNGVAWADDRQVDSLAISRHWSTDGAPGVRVAIGPLHSPQVGEALGAM